LITEQFGLCAYTGAPLDDRLGAYQGRADNLSFEPHIEHVKPRAVCQAELEARGGEYGRELCEDMDHRNLVAALEVKCRPPARAETFGLCRSPELTLLCSGQLIYLERRSSFFQVVMSRYSARRVCVVSARRMAWASDAA
jgi:hypothetical protein